MSPSNFIVVFLFWSFLPGDDDDVIIKMVQQGTVFPVILNFYSSMGNLKRLSS